MPADKETPSPVTFENVVFQYEEQEGSLFTGLTLQTRPGVTTLVGQNGTGKSTFLLLASGRLLPLTGSVSLFETPTSVLQEEADLNRYAAMLYQNMEFETEESSGDLLEFVRANGFHDERGTDPDGNLLQNLKSVLQLDSVLGRPLQKCSKGEQQRIIIAFSLLYGSRAVMMDEPVFAMEQRHKEATLEFLCDYARKTETVIFHSVHELHLAKRYADNTLLFFRDGTIMNGTVDQILTDDLIEKAYQLPIPLLHKKESLFRETLEKLT